MKKQIIEYFNNLYEVCDKDTCSDRLKQYYKENNRFLGHCSVVSYFVNKKFGGEIVKVYVPQYDTVHYLNKIDGIEYDLTKSQFHKPTTYEYLGTIDAQELRNLPHITKRIEIFENKLKKLDI